MVSPELALILVGTAVAVAVGVQHAWDRFSKRGMYQRGIALAERSLGFAERSAKRLDVLDLSALEKLDLSPLLELQGVGARLDKLIETITAASDPKAIMDALAVSPQVSPQVSGAIGADVRTANASQRQIVGMIGTDLLGQYGPLLEMALPSVHKFLVQNPEQLVGVLQMPVVQKLLVSAQQMFGKVGGGESSPNPFLR